MRRRLDPVKAYKLERLYYAIKECIEAGISAEDLMEELAESWAAVHHEQAEDGAAIIRRKP